MDSNHAAPEQMDLSTLESELAKSFQPSWATSAAPSEQLRRLANRAVDSPARDEHPSGRDFPKRGKSFGDRGAGSRRPEGKRDGRRDGRQERRHGARDRDKSPVQSPAAVKAGGWQVTFVPDPRGLEGMAAQIKASGRAYALFDLARLVLERPERYQIRLTQSNDTALPLWRLDADGSLWTSPREAESHALKKHMDTFYRIDREAAEPPKGHFPVIARCGITGTLLGPPNHHEYQSILRGFHAENFPGMPFEAFKNRVEMVREESVILKWKEERSTRAVYSPRTESSPGGPVEPPAASEGPSTPNVSDVSDVSDAGPRESSEVRFFSIAEVEEHFRRVFAPSQIARVSGSATLPGVVAMEGSAVPVVMLVRDALEDLRRFPLALAQVVGGEMQRRGLQVFKSPRKILYACVSRPRPLDPGDSQIAENIRLILRIVEASAGRPRAEQWKALVAAGADELSLAADLAWLTRQGHLIDYAGAGFEIPVKAGTPAGRQTKGLASGGTGAPSEPVRDNSTPPPETPDLLPPCQP